MAIEEPADSGFDIGAAMDSVATAMTGDAPKESEVPVEAETEVSEPEVEAQEPVAETPAIRPPPKSWAREKHELWSKLPPDAQEYYETREKQMLDGLEQYKANAQYAKQLQETLTPYKAMLQSQGVDEVSAIKYLMNAHYQLTNGTESSRRAAYERIGAELGFATQQAAQQGAPVDPTVKALQEKLERLESGLSARQEAERREAYAKHMTAVEAFAADEANVHFGDVAQDMVAFIKSGLPLKDAYDRAVWANPVTRAKEQARLQTEAQEQLKAKAKPAADAARKATAVNVRGAETRREPTEPKGSMDDTMRETLANMKRRVN